MWSFARVLLRLSEGEFWDLTPQEYYALVDRYNEGERSWDFRFGQVAIISAKKGGMKLSIGDIFPRLRQLAAPLEQSKPTVKSIAEGLHDWVAMCQAVASRRTAK